MITSRDDLSSSPITAKSPQVDEEQIIAITQSKEYAAIDQAPSLDYPRTIAAAHDLRVLTRPCSALRDDSN